MNGREIWKKRGFCALALAVACAGAGCAAPGTGGVGAAVSATPATPAVSAVSAPADTTVLLRVDQEEFTRADLALDNPQIFAPGVTHGKMLREGYIQRLIDFRLIVHEALRRGLDGSEAFRARTAAYLDAKGVEALMAELNIVEEKPDQFADSALAEKLIADQRRAKIRAALRQRGQALGQLPGRDVKLLESLAGADAEAVLARFGSDRVTVGQLRELLAVSGLAAPTEEEAGSALDELLLYREVVAAARSLGYRDRIAQSAVASGFRDKLLEALLGEALLAPGSLSAAAVSEYLAANPARYGRVEAVRLRRIVVADFATAAPLYKRLRRGVDFAQLAKENSIDAASAAAGGELGWVAPGTADIPPQAFELKEGEISRLITTAAGVTILRVDERRFSTTPLAAIEKQVRQDAEAAARGPLLRDLATGLRANATIWISEELTKK